MDIYGGIEAGGTKFVCAVADFSENILEKETVLTTSPKKTLSHVVEFFKRQSGRLGKIKSIGIGSFGPVDLNPDSPYWGYITNTPKTAWAQTDFANFIKQEFEIPVAFDTDVNAAAIGEYNFGSAKGIDTFLYLTVGTGIGGGGMVNGNLLHGLVHPEIGHLFVPHNMDEDSFAGSCPFHRDCLEGLASGTAIEKRWGKPGENIPEDHPAWVLEAKYLSYALVNLVCTYSPERIIIGGGVMRKRHLFPLIRKNLQNMLNGYIRSKKILDDIDNYIVPPGLGSDAGIKGAIILGILELD